MAIIFTNSWTTGEVREDWRRANVVPIFKRGKKEETGNYRPVSLTSIPGKQCIKHSICKYLEDLQPAWIHQEQIVPNQHDFLF